MEKVIAKATIIPNWKSGEGMRKINDYFLGGPGHWSDYVWVFGTLSFGIGAVIYVWNQIQ